MKQSKYKFKDPSAVMYLQGGETLSNSNLTDEKYAALIKLNPNHADQFEETRGAMEDKKTSSSGK